MKIANWIAGYQHIYLNECERQLTLHPSSVPYPRAMLLFCFFATLNLALLFALMHVFFRFPVTSTTVAVELTTIAVVVLAHVILLPNGDHLGSSYRAYEAEQVGRVKQVHIAYSRVSSFVPFLLLWMLIPRAI